MRSSDPAGVVAAGYDRIGGHYLGWMQQIEGDPRLTVLSELTTRLTEGARLLELGCGAGVPCTKLLAERFEVTGIDVSPGQVRRARSLVPAATFEVGDISTLERADDSLDAIASFYAMGHVPRAQHAALFERFWRWLRPGGLLLTSLGAGGTDDTEVDWLGAPMFFSSWDADTNRKLLRAAGFTLLFDEVIVMREPEGESAFLWVLAQRPRE